VDKIEAARYTGKMTTKLNHAALEHARKLVRAGKVVHNDQGDWSQDAPNASAENALIDKRGFDVYGDWHLGVDAEVTKDTKGRYSFPFGDFTKVHRAGVIAAEGRASQNGHDDIAKAAKELLELIDEKYGRP